MSLEDKKLGDELRWRGWKWEGWEGTEQNPAQGRKNSRDWWRRGRWKGPLFSWPYPGQLILPAGRAREPDCPVWDLTHMENNGWPWGPVCLDSQRWCLSVPVGCLQRGCVSRGRTLSLNGWVGGGRRIEVARAGRSRHIVHMCVGTFVFLDQKGKLLGAGSCYPILKRNRKIMRYHKMISLGYPPRNK